MTNLEDDAELNRCMDEWEDDIILNQWMDKFGNHYQTSVSEFYFSHHKQCFNGKTILFISFIFCYFHLSSSY